MFGPHDGLFISDAPDSISAAALSVTVRSTGFFKHLETRELLNQEQLSQVLSPSKDATQAYQPPASKGSPAPSSVVVRPEAPSAVSSGCKLPARSCSQPDGAA
jgi:hypothetical protein